MNEPEADLTDRRRPPGIDPGTKLLAMFAGGIGTLLVVVVGGWSLLGHHQGGGIPVVEPPSGPVRVKPIDPGGMQLMGGQAMSASSGSTAQALAPGPEAPAPEALQQEVDAARQADAPPKPAAVPPPVAPAAPAPVVVPAAPQPPSATAALPATPAPDAAPAAVTAAPAASQPVHATAATPPATDDAAPAAVPAPHGPQVQLAALDTEAAAQAEWIRLTREAPGLFAGRHPAIVRASRGGREFFRLRTGGFATLAEATAFCGHARQARVACTLADF